MATFNDFADLEALKSHKDVVKLGGARLRELELFLGIDQPQGDYAARAREAWEVIEAVRQSLADEAGAEEEKPAPKPAKKAKKAKPAPAPKEEKPASAPKPAPKPAKETEDEYLKLARKLVKSDPDALAAVLEDLDGDTLEALGAVPPAKKGKGGGGGFKKVGITDKIVEVLRKASANKPATKKDIWQALCDAFPERVEEDGGASMMSTVQKLPWTLIHQNGYKVYTVKLESGKSGYWMPKIGAHEEEEE